MPKRSSALIVVDLQLLPPPWRPCFKVSVTSQNSPQLLVSSRFDFAESIGSASIELMFA